MATQALGAGVDVRTVAGRGGWSNPTTLLTRYAHFLPARDQAAAELLDELLDDESAAGTRARLRGRRRSGTTVRRSNEPPASFGGGQPTPDAVLLALLEGVCAQRLKRSQPYE